MDVLIKPCHASIHVISLFNSTLEQDLVRDLVAQAGLFDAGMAVVSQIHLFWLLQHRGSGDTFRFGNRESVIRATNILMDQEEQLHAFKTGVSDKFQIETPR